jgi:hypothetical protein
MCQVRDELSALALVSLPNAERGAGGIGEHAHAAGIEDVERYRTAFEGRSRPPESMSAAVDRLPLCAIDLYISRSR